MFVLVVSFVVLAVVLWLASHMIGKMVYAALLGTINAVAETET